MKCCRLFLEFCIYLQFAQFCKCEIEIQNLVKTGAVRMADTGGGYWKNSNCCYLEVGWKCTLVFWLFSWKAGGLFQWPETPRSSSFSALSWIWRYSWKLCPCFSESCHQVTYLKVNIWVVGLWNGGFCAKSLGLLGLEVDFLTCHAW